MHDPCSTGTNVPPHGPDSNRETASLRSALWMALLYYRFRGFNNVEPPHGEVIQVKGRLYGPS